MTKHQGLLTRIEKFAKRQAISLTAFGRLAVKDPCLVGDIRRGRSPRLETVEKIDKFIREYAR